MHPLRVYCDSGGFRKELHALERGGQVVVLTYAYENSTRKIRHRAPGSNPTWDEGDSTWESAEGSWEDAGRTSHLWESILKLLGPGNTRDAKHLDSAVMANCALFLTSDFDDLASKSEEILALTGVRVFHAVKDWSRFLRYVEGAA